VRIENEQIQELGEMRGIAGIDIMDLAFRRWFPTPEIVEQAGLTQRPMV
jgi:hypothetical protein